MREIPTNSASLHVKNETDRPRLIWIEPWGADYTILTHECFELVARGQEPIWFYVVEHAGSTQVWLQNSDDCEARINSIPVQCGHQRQDALDAGLEL